MRCERCGKGIGVTRRGQAIHDGYICYKCLDELGFDKSTRSVKRWNLAYWEIKDGPTRINYNRAARQGKYEDWKRKHPEMVARIDALCGDSDDEPEEDEE